MSQTTIRPVTTESDRMRFIKSQWNFYKNDPNWVAPLIDERKKLLSVTKNPIYQHSKIEMFLAERDGVVVGRIAGITNGNHNKKYQDKVGFFGFFECENNQDTANKLFDAAHAWLKQQGMTASRGPVNPSMNDEAALLVEGFDEPPVILTTYNPAYYVALLENAGYAKAKDMYAYLLRHENYQSDKMKRLQAALRERYKITIREINISNKTQLEKDANDIKEIYNAAWASNWGIVPFTDSEFAALVKDLKPIADQRLIYFAEVDGKVAGFMLALPDINRALIHNRSGSLLGAGWNLFTQRSKVDLCRIIVMGVLPEYQKIGIDAVMYYEIEERSREKYPQGGEASWIAEDNEAMNRALTKTMNAKRYKTYRIYEKNI
ncbi:MAG: GNAT family N-acetyltransferase [Candidatus Kapaibacterium sp.]|nr:MAG: GNAT family N-acetyltransferase [Candidatus Kapabacteria bacterium]